MIRAKWTGGVAQEVERLLCKGETLSSHPNPNTPLPPPHKKKKKKKEKEAIWLQAAGQRCQWSFTRVAFFFLAVLGFELRVYTIP
jgi:hypothetical protein